MKNVNSLHNKAMDLAEKAFFEKKKGNFEEAKKIMKEAFILEKEAANLVPKGQNSETSRAILYRSAATLAAHCGDFHEAEKLVFTALSENPPNEISEELKDLYEQINFDRHLDLKGIILEENEMQLSIAGKGVGFGITSVQEFIGRIEVVKKMAYRTIERKLNMPFREAGTIKQDIKDFFQPYFSVPRAASFAVTIRLGKPQELRLPGFDNSLDILDDMINGIELVNQKKENILKKQINNEDYFANFVGLTKELAPDGESVDLVGFTVIRSGEEKKIALRRKTDDISLSGTSQNENITKNEKDNIIEVVGELSYANAATKQIKLTDENGKRYTLKVPKALMSDIVKPYWEDKVKIKGRLERSILNLIDIKRIG